MGHQPGVDDRSSLYPLVAVVGPTGAGKSDLALRLACLWQGEILNYDSVQIYRGLNIGSAKVSECERLGIPHHLIDIVDANGELTAGEYARRAGAVLEQLRERHTLPVMVGGTGFYLRALLDGLSPAPARNEKLRVRLTALALRRPTALHRFLRSRDAAAAEQIHPNDHQKLIRAVELGGRASAPRQALEGFRTLKIGLLPARERLYERLNCRTTWMFKNGLLEETEALLHAGVPADAKALGSLGYRQAVQVLRRGMPLGEAIADCQLRTRHYAKRQLTWFGKEAGVHWLQGFGNDAAVQEEAAALVRSFVEPHFQLP
jgi:tRNA dimethylallyltransferase